MHTPRQTLLDVANRARLGIECCADCGAGAGLGELCLYEVGGDVGVMVHKIWCRDCEAGSEGGTLAAAIRRWNLRAGGLDQPSSVV